MKRILIILTTILFLSVGNIMAQTYKFGYINTSELMQASPDIESLQKEMEEFAKKLELTIEEEQVEYNKIVDAFQKAEANLSEDEKATKIKEINELRLVLGQKMSNAESEYNDEYQKKMEPIRTKLLESIKKVGKANGFTYVFDISAGALPYFDETQAVDIMSLVKRDLGIR